MGIVYWTLMVGFLVGALGKFFFKRMNQGEVFTTMTMGLIGSVLGGWAGSKLGFYEFGNNYGLIASIVGASISVALYCYYYKKSII